MKDIKTLLEMLLEAFSKNEHATGLCMEIWKLEGYRKITFEERSLLHQHVIRDMNLRLKPVQGYAFYLSTFREEKPLRIQWIKDMISDLD